VFLDNKKLDLNLGHLTLLNLHMQKNKGQQQKDMLWHFEYQN
jgi:hypothetical protein